jgi:hypothetical protein
MTMSHDKQLSGFNLRTLQKKQRLDQALSAKEFALLAGVSYATAREWLHLPGFPALSGLVFWQDFVLWRRLQTGLESISSLLSTSSTAPAVRPNNGRRVLSIGRRHWPVRTVRLPQKAR